MNGNKQDTSKSSPLLGSWRGREDSFLGRGWGFPVELTERGVRMSACEQDIRESLRVLLATSPGERVNRYDYGCPLRRYAFEPMTVQTVTRMRNDITRAVVLFEPRVTLEEVTFEERREQGVLLIRLTYTVISTNNRNNMVYPFYLNEGTTANDV